MMAINHQVAMADRDRPRAERMPSREYAQEMVSSDKVMR